MFRRRHLTILFLLILVGTAFALTSDQILRDVHDPTNSVIKTSTTPAAGAVNEIEGDEAEDSTTATNPVVIGGRVGGGTGAVKALSTGADEVLDVDIASGSVAQGTGAADNAGWPVLQPPESAACKTTVPNDQGTAGADIPVDATAGGVAVLAASTTRCEAIITNAGTADMRCAPTTLTVTSTAGYLVQAGASLRLGLEGQEAYKCIRTGASSTSASVIEARS